MGTATSLYLLRQVERYREQADRLLANVLSAPIADRLTPGEGTIADRHRNVTVLFADIVAFIQLHHCRPLSGRRDAERVVLRVRPAGRQAGRGQIKTIGDAFIAASGLPDPRPDHVTAVLALALDTQAAAGAAHGLLGQPVRLRLGLNTGPVVAGVIGAWSPRHSPATSNSPRPCATKPATITGSPPASWSR